jgi:Flp pilus assembly protein TadD
MLYDLDAADLIDFAKRWSDLGDAVAEQVAQVVEDPMTDAVNPNAIKLARRRLGGLNEELDEAIAKALHAYGYLIRRGRLVNQLLPDLAQLVQKYPRDPLVWQTLGDALASTGDLEHANQSYAQARKYASRKRYAPFHAD